MLRIIKYYIPDDYAIDEFNEMNHGNERMEFDDIYLGDYQRFIIVNKSAGRVIEDNDTGHINLSNFLYGLRIGLNLSGINYRIDEEVISLDLWKEIKKNIKGG